MGNTIGTSSWSNNSISANAISFVPVTSISASWVSASVMMNSASYASTASWAINYTLPSQINVTGVSASFTGSHVGNTIGTASWSNNALTASSINFIPSSSISASYVPNLYPQVTQTTVASASWVSASVTINSASYANTSSWAINYTLPSQINVAGITASLFYGTASYASTASYALNAGINGGTQASCSWASQSLSASYATTYSYYTISQVSSASYAATASVCNGISYSTTNILFPTWLNESTASITGLTELTTASRILLSTLASNDDIYAEDWIPPIARNIVAGTGFTISLRTQYGFFSGSVPINWQWTNQ
jgi:hypothetical protein